MKDHYRKQHMNGPYVSDALPSRWTTVAAQKLDNSTHKSYFQVQPPAQEESEGDPFLWLEAYDKEVLDLVRPNILSDSDPRNVCALLRYTNWHRHVGKHSPNDLRSLVDQPQLGEFPCLRKNVDWIIKFVVSCGGNGIFPTTVMTKVSTRDPKT